MNEAPTRQDVLNEIAAMIDALVGDRLARMAAMALPGSWLAGLLDGALPHWREGTPRMQTLVQALVMQAEGQGRIHDLLMAVVTAFPEAESLCDELAERYWRTVELHAGPPLEELIDLPDLPQMPDLPVAVGDDQVEGPVTLPPQTLPVLPPTRPPTYLPTTSSSSADGGRDSEAHPEPPAVAEGAPRVETLRLDTAVPQRVVVGQAFKLAVAIKQIASPRLARPDLPTVESGDVEVFWLPGQAFVRLRIEISAPDCTIEGNDSDSFRLVAGRDSPIFLYHLTPKRQGPISIFVTVYQEEDRLGTAGLSTVAGLTTTEEERMPVRTALAAGPAGSGAGTAAGEVEVVLQSQPLNKLFPAAEAIQPLFQLALELVADDTLTPLLIAEQAGLLRAKLAQVAVPADQWWIVLVAAHEAKCVPAIATIITNRYPNRAADLDKALQAYVQAVAPVP